MVKSIYSTTPAERKTSSHVVKSMKTCISKGEVKEMDTKRMLTDILTKDSVKSDELIYILKSRDFWKVY